MPLTERDKRTLKIGGVIVGVMLAAFLLMNVLGGGDSGPEEIDVVQPTGAPPTEPPVSPTQTPTSTLTPVAVFTGRDPFSVPPGFSTSAPTSGTTTSGTGTSSTSTTSSTTTTSTSTTSTTSSPPPTQPGNGSSANEGGHEVVLLGVFPVNGVPTAQVEIDGTVYDVQVGDEFGPGDRFSVRSISGNCATLAYGSEGFTLCVTPQK